MRNIKIRLAVSNKAYWYRVIGPTGIAVTATAYTLGEACEAGLATAKEEYGDQLGLVDFQLRDRLD